MTEPTDILTRWFDGVWNQGREELIDELCDPQITLHGGGPLPIVGVDSVRSFWRAIRTSFPGVKVQVCQVVRGEASIACRTVAQMPHPTTGANIQVRGSTFARLQHGRFIEVHDTFDYSVLLEALGAVTPATLPGILFGVPPLPPGDPR